MTDYNKENYIDFTTSIDEFLIFKIKQFDKELVDQRHVSNNREERTRIIELCKFGEFICIQDANKKLEYVTINGMLADILEDIYQVLIEEKRIREGASKESILRAIPVLLSKLRKISKKLQKLISSLDNSEELSGDYIEDDRIEIILNALQKTTEAEEIIEKEYKHSPLFFHLGTGILFLFMLSLMFFVWSAVFREILNVLFIFFEKDPSAAINIAARCEKFFLKPTHFFFGCLAAYVITLKIYLKILSTKIAAGNISARFVSAFYYLNSFGFSIKKDHRRFVFEIIECAKSGYPPANYELGKLYETGYKNIIPSDIKSALQYYARAAKYLKKAQDRYDMLLRISK